MVKRGCTLKLFVLSLLLLALLPQSISAFGVATPFIENNTIKLEPGQRFEYTIEVQNNEKVSFFINLTYNVEGNVAKLRQSDFFIPEMSYDNDFTFDIEIPTNARPGKEYTLSWSARPLLNVTGQVPVSVQIARSITILVVDEFGIGYRETFVDRLWKPIAYFFGWMVDKWLYLLIPLLIISIFYISRRFWKISRNVSERILRNKAPRHEDVKEAESPETPDISSTKSVRELHDLLKKMPSEVFKVKEVKHMISVKLLELNKTRIAKKILTAESKAEILRLIK